VRCSCCWGIKQPGCKAHSSSRGKRPVPQFWQVPYSRLSVTSCPPAPWSLRCRLPRTCKGVPQTGHVGRSCGLAPLQVRLLLAWAVSWINCTSKRLILAWSLSDDFVATLSRRSEFARLMLATGLLGFSPFAPPLFLAFILPLSPWSVYPLYKNVARTPTTLSHLLYINEWQPSLP
jgi:hypothetical protein